MGPKNIAHFTRRQNNTELFKWAKTKILIATSRNCKV